LKQFRKNIPETALTGARRIEVGKIETPTEAIGVSPPRFAGLLLEIFRVETVLVVDGTLFRITQYVVGLLDLFKALLGRLITRIDVGVVLSGQASVGLFYLGVFRVPGDSENCIIVFFGHSQFGLRQESIGIFLALALLESLT
jgi:hypothetical protein